MPNNSVRLHRQVVKKAIRKGMLVDPFFLNLYSFSPYSSCQHGCIYCDGRAEKYHLEGEFEKDITLRTNITDILRQELPKLREHSPISIGSGITDVYQPIEGEIGIMRECASLLQEFSFPVSVLTKSSLILRDISLWQAVHAKSQFNLQISLTTLDESIREIFEPMASPVEERLETIRQFKKAGCPVGVFMMPLLPGITDTEENISQLLAKLKELEVDFVMPGFLTLRQGRQKDIYFQTINNKFPHLLPLYEKLYEKPLVSGSPDYRYRNRYKSKYQHLYNNIHTEAPHYVYRDAMPLFQELHLLLCHMKSLYRRQGVDVSALSDAYKRYEQWVQQEIKTYNRKHSLPEDTIDQKIRFLFRCGGFDEILQNEKLHNFLSEVALNRKLFDYQSLILQESQD